jgi:hypothetical protein
VQFNLCETSWMYSCKQCTATHDLRQATICRYQPEVLPNSVCFCSATVTIRTQSEIELTS